MACFVCLSRNAKICRAGVAAIVQFGWWTLTPYRARVAVSPEAKTRVSRQGSSEESWLGRLSAVIKQREVPEIILTQNESGCVMMIAFPCM